MVNVGGKGLAEFGAGTSAIVGGGLDDTPLNAQAHFAMLSLMFPF